MKKINIFLIITCLLFGLSTTQAQFSYQHPLEVVHNNNPGFALNSKIEQLALQMHRHLNQSILFDTSFVADPKKVRDYHLKSKHNKSNVGVLFKVQTKDQIIRCTFFDRNSDKLLVVGPGFTNPREYMSPFIDMFPDHDVLLFDFRGQGYLKFNMFDHNTWPFNLLEILPGINIAPDEVTLGREEDKDVVAVVKAFKKRKTYTEVHGLGICYGAFIFLKTAALNPGIFDRIVLDGCWLSLPLFVEKVRADLKSIWNPQTGGWNKHWLFSKPGVVNAIQWSVENLFGLELHDLSLMDYLHKVEKTKLLFFYGKDDLMVHRKEFELLWNELKLVEKTVVITSNPHVRNHWKQKELYKLCCDLFFTLDQGNFVNYLQNPDYLAQYQASLLTKVIGLG